MFRIQIYPPDERDEFPVMITTAYGEITLLLSREQMLVLSRELGNAAISPKDYTFPQWVNRQ